MGYYDANLSPEENEENWRRVAEFDGNHLVPGGVAPGLALPDISDLMRRLSDGGGEGGGDGGGYAPWLTPDLLYPERPSAGLGMHYRDEPRAEERQLLSGPFAGMY